MFPFDLFCNFSHSEKSYKFNFLPSVSPPASIILCLLSKQIQFIQVLSLQISSDAVAEDVFEPENSSIKKGLLWQQRDKLFSRWKERYFILTKDLLQCFKKETSKITEMGGFIFKVNIYISLLILHHCE